MPMHVALVQASDGVSPRTAISRRAKGAAKEP
jgi:hypothetical protein